MEESSTGENSTKKSNPGKSSSEKNNPETVSYTHLDVYKRQIPHHASLRTDSALHNSQNPRGRFRLAASLPDTPRFPHTTNLQSSGSTSKRVDNFHVSYTKLDVYKRQV